MLAFVVRLNGVRVCTIGVGDDGVLNSSVTWVGGGPNAHPEPYLEVSALDGRTGDHLRWGDPTDLKLGDTVTIQVIETDSVDAPVERKTQADCAAEDAMWKARFEAAREGSGEAP